jgi:hypothetical protein
VDEWDFTCSFSISGEEIVNSGIVPGKIWHGTPLGPDGQQTSRVKKSCAKHTWWSLGKWAMTNGPG